MADNLEEDNLSMDEDDLLQAALRDSGITPDFTEHDSMEVQLGNLLDLLTEAYGSKAASEVMKPLANTIMRETASNLLKAKPQKDTKKSVSPDELQKPDLPGPSTEISSGEDKGFLVPTKSAKRKAVQHKDSDTPVPVSNCFAALNEETMDAPDCVIQPDCQGQQIGKKRKVPPILVKKPAEPLQMSKIINEKFGPDTKTSLSGDFLRIQPKDAETYRAIRKQLDIAEMEYNTYLLAEEKPFKVVIKGLPTGDTVEEREKNTATLKESLDAQGIKASHVAPMKSYRTKKFMNMFLVEVPKNEGKSIFNVSQCFGMQVHVAKHRRRRGVGQCYRCQGYFHSSICCTAKPKCVKCAGDHLSKLCKKAFEVKPTCVNCGGDHTANFRGCPKFPKTTTNQVKPLRRGENREPTKGYHPNPSDFPQLATQDQQIPAFGVSFAEKLQNSASQETIRPPDQTKSLNSVIISILDTVSQLLRTPGIDNMIKQSAKKLLNQASALLDFIV